MKRIGLVSANWKANHGSAQDRDHLRSFFGALRDVTGADVTVHPPYTSLVPADLLAIDRPRTWLGAQDCSTFTSGAYTGEIACEMLASFGVRFVIIGHSERRAVADTDAVVAAKIRRAFETGLGVILCCGEPADVRATGRANRMIGGQLRSALEGLHVDPEMLVVAYEPIWAIGAGQPASPDDAQAMAAFIRQTLREVHSRDTAESVRIQYGGSVKSDNVAAFAACPDVDGVLVGGASLSAETFLPLVAAF